MDCAAEASVVKAVNDGIEADRAIIPIRRPWVMVSVNNDEDLHFRKAEFDSDDCPVDCSRPCENICPANAISYFGKAGLPKLPLESHSLSHRIRDEDWKYVVEMALRLFNSNKGRKGRKHLQWEVIKAPRQVDAKQCRYYVMRFMRQITEEVATIERDALRSIFTKAEYSQEEIDEVRSEVAECIQDHIYE